MATYSKRMRQRRRFLKRYRLLHPEYSPEVVEYVREKLLENPKTNTRQLNITLTALYGVKITPEYRSKIKKAIKAEKHQESVDKVKALLSKYPDSSTLALSKAGKYLDTVEVVKLKQRFAVPIPFDIEGSKVKPRGLGLREHRVWTKPSSITEPSSWFPDRAGYSSLSERFFKDFQKNYGFALVNEDLFFYKIRTPYRVDLETIEMDVIRLLGETDYFIAQVKFTFIKVKSIKSRSKAIRAYPDKQTTYSTPMATSRMIKEEMSDQINKIYLLMADGYPIWYVATKITLYKELSE